MMPYTGSVNQIESSDLTTMSFGELSRLPSNLSISTVTVPSYSVRVTLRPACSQVSSRPWRSREAVGLVCRFAKDTDLPRLLIPTSDAIERGIGPQEIPAIAEPHRSLGPAHATARRSMPALLRRYFAKLGSR